MSNEVTQTQEAPPIDVERIIEQTVEQTLAAFQEKQKAQAEPEAALHNELSQERKKRESLEKRVNELIEEGRRARESAEQSDRFATIKSELQQLGVTKVDLAFRAVRDDVQRDGERLLARTEDGSAVPLRDYLTQWVAANPEFKPARIAGGAGTTPSRSGAAGSSSFDMDRIRPGMSAEDMEKARLEIARVAAHALGGQTF